MPGTGSYDIDMTSASAYDLEDLPLGFYRLSETHAPARYVILDKYVYFRIEVKTIVNQDKKKESRRIVTLTDEHGKDKKTNEAHVKLSGPDKNGVYTITVYNNPGVALPSTGGVGTTVFHIAGSLLLVLAAGLLIVKRRQCAARQDSSND